jgi:hypothetical protein
MGNSAETPVPKSHGERALLADASAHAASPPQPTQEELKALFKLQDRIDRSAPPTAADKVIAGLGIASGVAALIAGPGTIVGLALGGVANGMSGVQSVADGDDSRITAKETATQVARKGVYLVPGGFFAQMAAGTAVDVVLPVTTRGEDRVNGAVCRAAAEAIGRDMAACGVSAPTVADYRAVGGGMPPEPPAATPEVVAAADKAPTGPTGGRGSHKRG